MRWDTDSKEPKKQLRPDQMLLVCVISGVIGASVLSIFVAGTQAMSLFLLAGFLVGLAVGSTVATSTAIKQHGNPIGIEAAYSKARVPSNFSKLPDDQQEPKAHGSSSHTEKTAVRNESDSADTTKEEPKPDLKAASRHADKKDLPAGQTPEEALTPDKSKYSHFDYDGFVEKLLDTADPMAELKLIVREITHREQAWEGLGHWSGGYAKAERMRLAAAALGKSHDDTASEKREEPDSDQLPIPSGIELFLAHQLRDAGLFDEDIELPRMHIVRPHASGMLYLRVEQGQTSYGAMLAVLRIEAALNAVRFASRYFDEPDSVSEQDCYSLQQRITNSVVAQAAPIDQPGEPIDDGDPNGEWAVRRGISHGIESFQLPFRLVASFRTNVSDGNAAIEIMLTPADAFPKTVYVPQIGLTQTTKQMRREAASLYALRLALLLAGCAFRTSEHIKHVWVAGILDTATRHSCYYSIDFDRWRFSKLDLENIDDLESALHPFCPTMRLEDGFLRPVGQTFALSEERFCPQRRFESITLSSRRLSKPYAEALGTDHVSGLAIDEADKREALADDILRNLASPTDKEATAHDVHAILSIAGDDPDPAVRSAAERTADKLVRGTISEDPLSVAEEFVAGDALTRASAQAQEALGARNAKTAIHLLDEALAQADSHQRYSDSDHVVWRYFATFVDRALYNRLNPDDGRSVMLVPRSYFNAHLLASLALIADGRAAQAADHARLLVRIAPLDTRSHLQLVQCYESLNKDEDAIAELKLLLEVAHDPQGIGTAYYRMAFFQWRVGNYLAAQACYSLAMKFLPSAAPTVALEMATLSMQGTGNVRRDFSEQELSETLQSYGIPEAPTDRIAHAFFECARASLDAEIFPVARMFMSTLAAFAPDDITVGMMRSLEDSPGSLGHRLN